MPRTRLKAWSDGKIDLFLHEGRTIQSHLTSKPRNVKSEAELAQTFAKLMFEGKIRPAIRLLTDHSKGGSLNLDDHVLGSEETVREALLAKHLKGEPMKPSAVTKLEAPV